MPHIPFQNLHAPPWSLALGWLCSPPLIHILPQYSHKSRESGCVLSDGTIWYILCEKVGKKNRHTKTTNKKQKNQIGEKILFPMISILSSIRSENRGSAMNSSTFVPETFNRSRSMITQTLSYWMYPPTGDYIRNRSIRLSLRLAFFLPTITFKPKRLLSGKVLIPKVHHITFVRDHISFCRLIRVWFSSKCESLVEPFIIRLVLQIIMLYFCIFYVQWMLTTILKVSY